MGNVNGSEALLSGISTPQFSMNNHGSGYSDHILDCTLFCPIAMVTSNSTVSVDMHLDMQISSKLLGIVDTIICGVTLHWKSFTHGLPINLYLGYDCPLSCEGELMISTDISGGCTTEDSLYLVYLRGCFVSYFP